MLVSSIRHILLICSYLAYMCDQNSLHGYLSDNDVKSEVLYNLLKIKVINMSQWLFTFLLAFAFPALWTSLLVATSLLVVPSLELAACPELTVFALYWAFLPGFWAKANSLSPSPCSSPHPTASSFLCIIQSSFS